MTQSYNDLRPYVSLVLLRVKAKPATGLVKRLLDETQQMILRQSHGQRSVIAVPAPQRFDGLEAGFFIYEENGTPSWLGNGQLLMSGASIDPVLSVPETSESSRPRKGMALCLSGGGYRAALFHLGAVRRLNELGVLARLDTISSVSGGSILAAHLARALNPWPTGVVSADTWEAEIAKPFRAFTKRNIRTWPILKRFLLPWNWGRSSFQVESLRKAYQRHLTTGLLADLPEKPKFVFCATNMIFGVNWIMTREKVGDYLAGYCAPPTNWTVARAVAASSCFPPVFGPMSAGLAASVLKRGKYSKKRDDRDALVEGTQLTDGGVYDNMGLEPVWKDHHTVLVSDGGGVFPLQTQKSIRGRLLRYSGILGRQAAALRQRWLIAMYEDKIIRGAYWGIKSATSSYGLSQPEDYSKEFASETIARIRTDLDAFSNAEAAILENHGYRLASVALEKHVSELCVMAPPPTAPHPQWVDMTKAESTLVHSHRRKKLGRW